MESSKQEELQDMLRTRIRHVLRNLTYREREIIILRFGLQDGYSYTLEEVGRIFNLSREGVRLIEIKALRKLQLPAGSPPPVKRIRKRRKTRKSLHEEPNDETT